MGPIGTHLHGQCSHIGHNSVVMDTAASSQPRQRVVTLAYAHSGKDTYVILEWRETGIGGSVQFPVSDLNEVIGLSIAQDVATAKPQLADLRDQILGYTERHFSISADGEPMTLELRPCEFVQLRTKESSYVVVPYRVANRGRQPTTLEVDFDGIISELPDRPALLVVKRPRGVGPLSSFDREQRPFDPKHTSHTVESRTFSTAEHATTAVVVALRGAYRFVRRTTGKALRAAGLRD